ncbi:MAG TPA: hypothetical protein DIW27_04660, partial [Cytophagales bacterium]|nr:hypothetical protein [Cytophagales bacterium]
GSDKSVAQIGFSIYQNSYKGLGYTLDASFGFTKSIGGLNANLGVGLSLDNNEGIGVSPSISLAGEMGQFGLNAPYNSKDGLTSISLTHGFNVKHDKRTDENSGEPLDISNGNSSASISLAGSSYTPQVSMPMNTISISAQLKFGGAWFGVFGSPYLTGYHTKQYLTTDKKRVTNKAYGYLNYQHAQTPYEPTAMLDFNREKDGMVSKETPNLGIPSLTYDIYSVTGQGISMMYRPMRTDYGTIYDPATTSGSTAASFGVDVGIPSHVGVNLTVNHANSFSGKWTDADNQLATKAKFQGYAANANYEPWLFKVHAESVSTTKARHDSIGGDRPVRIKLTGDKKNPIAGATLEPRSGASLPVPNNADLINRSRYPRNQLVTPIKNGELLSASGTELISLFKVKYIDSTGTLKPFNRSNALDFPRHHFAGYTALTGDGLRYVYGLPAYNLLHEEVQFSVPHQSNPNTTRVVTGTGGAGDPSYSHANTDKYLKRTEISRYAHSYLLTAIVGPDYVDLTNDGVTPDDLGYWVKFTYKKTTDDYKWRDPFRQAHLQEGWRHDYRDDKGAFTYGKKQLFYLTRAETKSHIAEFEMSERSDARGVLSKLQDTNGLGKNVFALQQIKLFTRSGGSLQPIKTTRFEYDNSLCLGIDNGTGGQGKLTLKKVWFEYGGSQRGALNPYEFTYHSSNPNYDILTYDRWGNYRPFPENKPRYNVDFPYVNQDPLNKIDLDAEVASWSLTEIKLPSGGTIKVDYESDDYAYVQNKEAMQMTAIVNPYQNSQSITAAPFLLDQNNYKIRFKLEQPIEGTLTPPQQKTEVLKYIDTQSWQLYLKLKINLRKAGEAYYEFINGYADINKTGAMGLETDASGKYAYGYFHLAPDKKKHPFSMRAWQHLRTNQPDLANIGKQLDPAESTGDKIKQIKGLGGLGAQIRQMFEGFYNYCDNKNWGKQIDPTQSWIRLKSPDLVKYGGGLRVKQITMTDAWSHDNRGSYGQYYEYTTVVGGKTISS